MTKQIEATSAPVDDMLAQLRERTEDMEPFLRSLGENMVERIKGRFGTGTSPDGTPWAANSLVTLAKYIQSRGRSPKKNPTTLPTKHPLIANGDMSTGIHYQATREALLVASPAPQAFMMQFGGKKADFPHLWGDIPARPFFPIQPDGSLYQVEEGAIVAALTSYLMAE